MRALVLLCVLLLAACAKSATAPLPPPPPPPPGTDPSVLVINTSPRSGFLIFAHDSANILRYDTVAIAPNTILCTRWLQGFDSLYTRLVMDPAGQNVTYTTPWLHFAEHPYYFQRDTVSWLYNQVGILARIDSVEC